MRKHIYASGTALVLGAAVLSPGVSAQATVRPHTSLVSVNSAGKVGRDISGRSARPVLSSDGSVVAFDSIANNLVDADTNRANDVFVRDRSTGVTERISVSSTGQQANGDSSRPDISGDGRLVAFDSTADNLVPGDGNPSFDVFVRDRQAGTTILVSEAFDGGPADGPSSSPVISRNGKYVAFTSNATNLTRKPGNGGIYLRNLKTGRTTVASLRLDGSAASASSPSLSANGQRVAFASDATNLVPGDTNAAQDIFVHDTATGATVRASVASDGTQGNRQSNGPGIRGGTTFGPDLSADGRFVTFDSIASNLVTGDTNTCSYSPGGQSFPEAGECPDVFVHDLETGTTTRVSVSSSGDEADNASTDPSISYDGSTVAFFSTAAFVAADTNTCPPFFFGHAGQCPDIYVQTR